MSIYFNIQEYGAIPDGESMNTKAIQSAIDACSESGGGIVLCGAGVFITGSFKLKSNVELRLLPGCTIQGSTDIDDYEDFISDGFKHELAAEGTSKYLIGASHARNIAISGNGEVNASGVSFYDQTAVRDNGKFAKKPPQRPRILMLHECKDIKISNASFIDSPCWTFWLMKCERVNIHAIKIIGDQRMINNDGIDIDSCKNVTVSDCYIKTDDDCIVLRSIQKVYDTPGICENVVISNCVLDSSCQCVRVGCPNDYIVRNCSFSNITMSSSQHGITFGFPSRYFTKGSTGSADISNISFANIQINSTRQPIWIYVEPGIKLRQVKGISFSDINIVSKMPCVIQGNELTTIEAVSFNNINIDIAGDQGIYCSQCKGIKMNNVNLSCSR